MTFRAWNLNDGPSCRTVSKVCFCVALFVVFGVIRSVHGGVWHALWLVIALLLVRVTSRCEEL